MNGLWKRLENDSIAEGLGGIDDVNEFRLDDQITNDEEQNTESENIIQKKNLSIGEKEYKIFTTKFDEISKAENLEEIEEISKLRKN